MYSTVCPHGVRRGYNVFDLTVISTCVHIYSTAHSSRYAIGKLKSCEVMLKSESAQLYKAAPSLGVYGVFVHHFYLVH